MGDIDTTIYCRTCDEPIEELDKMIKYDPGDYECIDCYCLKTDREFDRSKENG